MAQIRKFFAGGNTTKGFYSFFDEIMDQDANRRFILKGGPGTGKSTFMKKISAEMNANGYDVEEFYCSSDVTSLDGIAIPALKIGVMDGTAPHIIEPEYAGCVDEIINLGDYWDGDAITKRKDEIIRLTKMNQSHYRRSYRYLGAAKQIYEDMCEINDSCFDFQKIYVLAESLISEIFTKPSKYDRLGRARHLFASAITPQGLVNQLPSIMKEFRTQVVLLGEVGNSKSLLIKKIMDQALKLGFYVEAYHCPIRPTLIEHISIPDLDLAIISSQGPHNYQVDAAWTINLNEHLNQSKRVMYQYVLHKDFVLFEELVNLAIKQLGKAKNVYADLEQNYIPYMDFNAVQHQMTTTIEKIMSFTEKYTSNDQ